MKQIPLLQGKALLIELPEGAQGFGITDNNDLGWYIPIWNRRAQDWDWDGSVINLPPGNWQIVGMLSEVTESEASGIVDSDDQYGVTMYRNYKTTGMPYYDEQITAIESLDSSILAKGYYLDESPIKRTQFTNPDIWDSIQSRVLCRERCLLLGRVGV